eukprot:TRINITY_DN10995_c1_g1_i2.p1 TRINITY_DN10995_c1_g1~~TRINITY_DN10995_c1_g1_i2.p1  ORF type:complete len:535 (+),score=167.60 TRINITY_DN10995_c1_g1_i2:84-1607(+)
MVEFAQMLGPTLTTQGGDKSTAQHLAGKSVMLLFSVAQASTAPSKDGHPNPIEAYRSFYGRYAAAKNFEIILLAGDKTKQDYDRHVSAMPWPAVPFDPQRKIEARLRHRFDVMLPYTLVLLDARGRVITTHAMDYILEADKDGANFPRWGSQPFAQVIGDKFFKKQGASVGAEAIRGKTVGVIFSTPTPAGQTQQGPDPCQQFVKDLCKFHKEYKAQGGQLQLVLSCPPEGDYQRMAEHFERDLPDDCICIPFGDKQRRIELGRWFDVQGMPAVGIVNPDGTKACPSSIAMGKIHAGAAVVRKEGWGVPPLGDLSQGPGAAGIEINKSPAIVVRMEGCSAAEHAAAERALSQLAQDYISAAHGANPEIIFCISKHRGAPPGAPPGAPDPAKRLADLTKRNGGPLIMLFDIPDDGAFYVCDQTDVSAHTIKDFIKRWHEGNLPRKQLDAPAEGQHHHHHHHHQHGHHGHHHHHHHQQFGGHPGAHGQHGMQGGGVYGGGARPGGYGSR